MRALLLGAALVAVFYAGTMRSIQPLASLPQVGIDGGPVTQTEQTLEEVISRSLPSVGTISVRGTLSTRRDYEDIDRNIGSGFVISNKGYVVTNKHVVSLENGDFSFVVDEREFPVEEIYRDSDSDIAVLKVFGEDLIPLELGTSETLKLGQPTIAIGTSFGQLTNTVTTGIISGLGRGVRAGSPFEGDIEELDNVIQTDAAIKPGNSGGDLFSIVQGGLSVSARQSHPMPRISVLLSRLKL